jgi:hypothetical protein
MIDRRRRAVAPEQPPQVLMKTLKYGDAQEHLLRRLGSALVLQWDALPDDLQDLILDQAAVVDDRDDAAHAADDIQAFVRDVKTSALAKAPQP